MIQKILVKLDIDCIIIGAGIAGMTAAIYLKRSNVNTLIIEKEMPGGQLNKIDLINNYPGFSNINGTDLALNIYNQITLLDIDYQYGDVQEIIDKKEFKIVKTDKKEYTCRNVIIASGRNPRRLDISNENELTGKGISYCAVCDGPLYRGKDVAVVGGGNSALQEALYLSDICNSVIIIHHNQNLRADQSLIEKVKNTDNITLKYDSVVKTLISNNNKITSIELENKERINIDGLFVYIGSVPNTSFIKKLPINMDDKYIIVDNNMSTNIKGIYACGDVIKKDLYQLVTAASEGAIVANAIKKDIINS